MTAIVFGSPEAAAVLKRDTAINNLEDMALDNASDGFWVFDSDLTPEQRRLVRKFVDVGFWEDSEPDKPVTNLADPDRLYRPNEDERNRLTAEHLPGGGS